ncbi:hypothetical protein AQ915_20560 [Burkholderia pseudomallei]|uniref:hypothetical protein n=1 Tax=Burkholderia pseudomallei TaxID=28450 RepID=UPI00097583B8|nr:hypothetical protein [Burkholderia pseudomallei]ONC30051.1 hypothetical protein AQ915_20560 [Burkholderia pseudomallei]
MKTIFSLARALGHEIHDSDMMGFLRLVELVALVLAVPIVALMVAYGSNRPADPGYWIVAVGFTILLALFAAGRLIQYLRALSDFSRGHHSRR